METHLCLLLIPKGPTLSLPCPGCEGAGAHKEHSCAVWQNLQFVFYFTWPWSFDYLPRPTNKLKDDVSG